MLGTTKSLNVVFILCIPFPRGMAGTKRVQHAVGGLRGFNDVDIQVVITRQATTYNPPTGHHGDVPYQTLLPDMLGWKGVLQLPKLYTKSHSAVKNAFQPGAQNVLFVYGAPSIDNMPAVRYARRIGYQIVFDIVEDNDFASMLPSDWFHNIKVAFTRVMSRRIAGFADGIVVISSHLENKFVQLTREKVPIHHRSISVDPLRIRFNDRPFNPRPAMFYAGSFGVKDNIMALLDAFDSLASRHGNLRLIMTGKGSPIQMEKFMKRVAVSPARQRIEYRGYLDDDTYYKTLADVDIPCMTRQDSGYAHAGFPFKLGEFLATGRPVIASLVSDIEEYLEDRRTAFLVRPGSMSDIIETVEYVLSNENASREIGRRGRDQALLHWDYRIQGQALYQFLRRLDD